MTAAAHAERKAARQAADQDRRNEHKKKRETR